MQDLRLRLCFFCLFLIAFLGKICVTSNRSIVDSCISLQGCVKNGLNRANSQYFEPWLSFCLDCLVMSHFCLDSRSHHLTPGCLQTNSLCVKSYQDLIKLRQENFLTYLDKILSRSYQGVRRNVCLSRSWLDVSSFARVNKILHHMGRCVKFRFTGKTIQFVQLNIKV